ncbi:MAG: ribonuclease P protein component [Candidatus Pacebacteria bacterium]|nr:ribonuclease P protein component [Candidatus Paceibacterota bacterium]
MLPKKNRLKKKNDFARVMRQGSTAAGGCLVLRFCANQQEASRIGFVCSKKVAKRAVARNRVKRRLREIVRMMLPDIRPGYDMVFLTRPGMAETGFDEMKLIAEKLLKKARLIAGC